MLVFRSFYNFFKWFLIKNLILFMIKCENIIIIFFGDVIKLKILMREVEWKVWLMFDFEFYLM